MADTSIYANYLRPVKSVADYDADYQRKQANAFTLEKAGLESNALRQAAADDQATRQAYMGGGDLNAVLHRLTGGGQYKAAQALQKQIADQNKATADVGKVKADTAKTEMEIRAKRIDTVGAAMGYLKQNPTLENAKMLNDWMIQQGLSTAEQGAKDWADIQANPDKIAQFADLGFRAALSAKDQLPKLQNVNAGGYMLNQAVDPLTGKATETGRDMVTENEAQRLARERQAADAAAGRAVTIRGQNMTDARARDANEQSLSKPFEVTGADGKPMLVQQDKQGNIRPVQGYSPKDANKPMTDAQAKALLFGSRMTAANKILDDLADKGTSVSVPGSRMGFGVGATINVLQPAQQQMLDQSKRDFINATLRRESGAVISESEFNNAEKQYFPQVGDSVAVKAQKKSNREIAMRGILAEVPKEHQGKIKDVLGSSKVDKKDLFNQADAIIGGK